jgi:hypothetical protein
MIEHNIPIPSEEKIPLEVRVPELLKLQVGDSVFISHVDKWKPIVNHIELARIWRIQ